MSELELPYVPIDPGIEESEAMDLLVDALGVDLDEDPLFPMRVVRFLLWVGRERVDGNLKRITPRKISSIMCWGGDGQRLLAALVEAGWVTESEAGYRVSGWEKHGGRVLREREIYREKERLKKQRQRCARNSHPADSCECPGVVPRDVPGTSRGQAGDVPGESPVRPRDVPVMKGEGRRVKGEGCKTPHHCADSLSQTSDVESFAANEGWVSAGSMSRTHRARAHRITEAGPIDKGEIEHAKGVVASKTARGKDALGLFLGVVENERKRAEEERARGSPGKAKPKQDTPAPTWGLNARRL